MRFLFRNAGMAVTFVLDSVMIVGFGLPSFPGTTRGLLDTATLPTDSPRCRASVVIIIGIWAHPGEGEVDTVELFGSTEFSYL